VTKHYESMHDYNLDNCNMEMTDDNLHDFCQRCDGFTGEDNLLEVKITGSYRASIHICESCYDNNLDWYSLIL